ncbi:MAG TPA: bifunctional diguanylate cyclase/phosphodiesterase, partial [Gemmatirosa sp.]
AAATTRRTVSVLFVDLDDFKAVNDALGHAVGDRLLGEVAARLQRATRGCDTVARLGGDEFAVLLEHVADVEDGARVAERIGGALATPFTLDGRDVRVTASIGIASDAVSGCHVSAGEYAGDETPGDAADRLLRHADVAMYRAKARGKACHVTFSPAMQREVVDRLELGIDLDRAVADESLTLAFQPIVDLADGRVAGFEALARWTHPVRGFVSPALFIPLAEQTGAILALGQWVLYRACAAAARWGSGLADAGAPAVTVNVSGRQLQDPALPSVVAGALHASGLAPERLTLEITEGVLMEDTESTLERLHALRALGVRLAVDDFGTGYSSLAYLHRFPIDVLKLDKTFVDGVARGGRDAVLARTIVTLGATMQLRTVAEGIEHAGQRDALREMGCPLGQGYLFSRPVPEGDVAALLARDRLA